MYTIKRQLRSGAESLEHTTSPKRVESVVMQAYRQRRKCTVRHAECGEVAAVWRLNGRWVWYLDPDIFSAD